MKYFLLSLLLLVSGYHLLAQDRQDSIAIAQIQWQDKTIKRGIVWRQAHFNQLFNSQQEINLIAIDLNNKAVKLGLEGFADTLFLMSEIAKATHATVAINGAFFDTKNGGGVTLLKKDGTIINRTTMFDKKGKPTERSNGALILDGKRTTIINADPANMLWDEQLKAKNMLVCGPVLISKNHLVNLEKNAFNDNRHPRSAIAISTNNKLLLITADGRNAQAQGMNLHELAFFLKVYGAKDALNLDGGGSTTLYVKGQGTSGVVNYPSDNKLFDHQGERKVANILLVY